MAAISELASIPVNQPLAVPSGKTQEQGVKSEQASPGGDTVSISPEAQSLAAGNAAAIEWGPDIINGWNDENYLRQHHSGSYTGSLSFTTKNGSTVGVSAIADKSESLLVTVQDAGGRIYQYQIGYKAQNGSSASDASIQSGGVLRINETEAGIVFTESNIGTDGDDIIISMCGARGLGGNDTIINVDRTSTYGGTSSSGGDGDDLLVDITSWGIDSSGGAGDDTILVRNINKDYSVSSGLGNDTITIDNLNAGSVVSLGGNESTNNTCNIGVAAGKIFAYGGNNTLNIDLLTGSLEDGEYANGHLNVNINMARGARISIRTAFDLSVQKSYNSTYEVGAGKGRGRIGYGKGNLAWGNVNIENGDRNFVTGNQNIFAYARYFGVDHILSLYENFDEKTILRSFVGMYANELMGQNLNEKA